MDITAKFQRHGSTSRTQKCPSRQGLFSLSGGGLPSVKLNLKPAFSGGGLSANDGRSSPKNLDMFPFGGRRESEKVARSPESDGGMLLDSERGAENTGAKF